MKPFPNKIPRNIPTSPKPFRPEPPPAYFRWKDANTRKRHELKEYLMRVQHVPERFADQIVEEAWRIFRS